MKFRQVAVAISANRFDVRENFGGMVPAIEERDLVVTGEGCRNQMPADKSCPADNQEFHRNSPEGAPQESMDSGAQFSNQRATPYAPRQAL
jgi:hypothetical protein